ncbi:cupin domain-containing protein [Methylosinus sp. Ce-a6]|uniref:cupin domain-containing protein n=1 Tax=Methylosinus sp. Ce-a6 TaxID=2172005 RepID=UPI001358C828|nr:cupin domain-containing protein [Methylosinus sp. Ce-a6]
MLARSLLCASLALWAGEARAEGPPQAVLQSALNYSPVPLFTGVFAAPVSGAATQPGALYAISVKYAAGARSLPHTHPDARVVTVISGRFHAGVGTSFDEKSLRVLGPGDSIVVPAETVHFGWAKDGEVLLLETGVGPSGASLWPKPPPTR